MSSAGLPGGRRSWQGSCRVATVLPRLGSFPSFPGRAPRLRGGGCGSRRRILAGPAGRPVGFCRGCRSRRAAVGERTATGVLRRRLGGSRSRRPGLLWQPGLLAAFRGLQGAHRFFRQDIKFDVFTGDWSFKMRLVRAEVSGRPVGHAVGIETALIHRTSTRNTATLGNGLARFAVLQKHASMSKVGQISSDNCYHTWWVP